VLTLPGAVNLALLLDGRWSAFRTIFQAQIVSLVAIVGALLVRQEDVQRQGPGIVFAAGIAVSLAAYLVFYAYCERRGGTGEAARD
jgi:uncharacterized membrane protein